MALGQSEEKRTRLKTLEEAIWINADKLQRPDFDPLLNDHRIAVRSLQHLTQGVCRALRIQDGAPVNSWTCHGVPLSAVEVTRRATNFVEKPSDVGSLWLLQGLARCLLLASGDEVDPVEKRKLKSVLQRREADRAGQFLHVHRMHHELIAWVGI